MQDVIRRRDILTDTVRLYYKSAYIKEFKARVLACGECDGGWEIILDRTAFYPEGGGQPCDTGRLVIDEEPTAVRTVSSFVTDVRERYGSVMHLCDSYIEPGTEVRGYIDWERRFDHMQQHSGEHIVSGMICSRFGCDNVGFHMGKDIVTIDYNAEIDMSDLRDIEARANRSIWENHAVEEMHSEDSVKELPEYRRKKEISGDIRIISFPGADTCACCGTHVSSASEVGLVKFISCRRFTKGSRIELLCGKRAFEYLSMNTEQNCRIAEAMAASPDRTSEVYAKQKSELIAAKLKTAELEKMYNEAVADKYAGRENVLLFEESSSPDSLRRLCVTLTERCGGICAVFGGTDGEYKYAVCDTGSDNNSFVKIMNDELNGRGGGKGNFAQGSVKASGKDIEKFFERLSASEHAESGSGHHIGN